MSYIDIVISGFLIFWGLYGFFRGLVSELVSLVCWASAIYVAANFLRIPTEFVNEYIQSKQLSMILAFVLIFISTFILSSTAGFILSRFIGLLGLGFFNRIVGLLFGFLKGTVFIVIIIYILDLTEFRDNIIYQESKYISFFDAIIKKYLTKSNSFLDDMGLTI
mgnify:FL=1|tara:strand:- start:1108 stop:1599 length:492 start_codon:yes stop_codon:yes gene_type:complete